jgi:polysaccharide export outer membrane protein
MVLLTRKLLFSVLILSGLMLSLSATPAHAFWDDVAFWESNDAASVSAKQSPQPVAPVTATNTQAASYILGSGDKVKLTVFGEADLSGEYEVGSTGTIAVPLIGNVQAQGLTLEQFEMSVRRSLMNGYLRDPRVNAEMVNYRPFFILGEVSNPGSYPYVSGMTVLNAVALGGGYTYRADKSGTTVTRGKQKAQRVDEETTIIPGDIVRVPERFF